MSLTHIGVDIGSSKLSISQEETVVYSQPSVVAIRKRTNEIVACGYEAFEVMSSEPGEITLSYPQQEGRVTDVGLVQAMLTSALHRVWSSRLRAKPRVLASASSLCTPLSQRALIHAVTAAGASSVEIVPTVSAVAAGVGIEAKMPDGAMVVDIGSGTTDIGLVSMGEVVCAHSLPIGGQAMDYSIVAMVRARYGIEIPRPIAEKMKVNAFSLKSQVFHVVGLNTSNGLPAEAEITSQEVSDAVQTIIPKILEAMASLLERAGPELAGDIGGKGVVLTGGCSYIPWLKSAVSHRLGLPAFTVDDATHTCVRGLGALSLSHISKTEAVFSKLVQGFRTRVP